MACFCPFCIFLNTTANNIIVSISQELTKGVKGSMRTIHTVEAKLRQLTPSTHPGDPTYLMVLTYH
jgi:hypothetical protein